MENLMELCYCNSGLPFAECCEPVLVDIKNAKTAEAVMRSRYSAYVLKDYNHLYESLHPDHRKDFDQDATKQWAEAAEWVQFELMNKDENDEEGKATLEFAAHFKIGKEIVKHHEISTFEKIEGCWYFVNGDTVKPVPVKKENKVNRNDPCPCGSGQKYKKCCGK